jgi:hypothetical protein
LALGHPGEIVAIFHRYGLSTSLWKVLPHACIDFGELDWVVARLPAATRPLLAERERGLVGLVLADDYTWSFDAERCGLLLRNLLTSLGCPDLADHVSVHRADRIPPLLGIQEETAEVNVRLHWQQVGFGTGLRDNGTTREQCMEAMHAAFEGMTVRAPSGSGRRPSTKRRPSIR